MLQPIYPKSDALARCQKVEVSFYFQITAAKTFTLLAGASTCLFYGVASGGALSQASLDLLSGGVNDIPAGTVFDSTSVPSSGNVMGFVLDCQGQARSVSFATYSVTTTAGGTPASTGYLTTVVPAATSATAGITVSPYGNIYGRILDSNLGSGTAGFVRISIYFDAK